MAAYYDSIITEHLRYDPLSRLVDLHPEPLGPDGDYCLHFEPLGSPRVADCPIPEYDEEWQEIRRQLYTPQELYEDAYGP